MDILFQDPSTWNELQDSVSEVLQGCGYTTETEKVIDILRGSVEVDVYASKSNGHKTILICECKQLNRNVTQNVVHAFKSVVEGAGASQGFIITKKGFQKGAIKAVINTNISLFTWTQFLQQFEMEWLSSVIRRNENIGKELQAFGTYLMSKGAKDFGELYVRKERDFLALRNLYSDYIFYTLKEHYTSLVTNLISKDEVLSAIKGCNEDISTPVSSYKEYFDQIYNRCKRSISDIENLFDNTIIWGKIKENEKGY